MDRLIKKDVLAGPQRGICGACAGSACVVMHFRVFMNHLCYHDAGD